jgi:hypothetical protein
MINIYNAFIYATLLLLLNVILDIIITYIYNINIYSLYISKYAYYNKHIIHFLNICKIHILYVLPLTFIHNHYNNILMTNMYILFATLLYLPNYIFLNTGFLLSNLIEKYLIFLIIGYVNIYTINTNIHQAILINCIYEFFMQIFFAIYNYFYGPKIIAYDTKFIKN